jgi:hypothetical protein
MAYIVERQISDGTVDYWGGVRTRWTQRISESAPLDKSGALALAEVCEITLGRLHGPTSAAYATFHVRRRAVLCLVRSV